MNGSHYCLITGKTLSWKDVTGKVAKVKPIKPLPTTIIKLSNQLREEVYSSKYFNLSEKEISKLLNMTISAFKSAISATPSFGNKTKEEIEQLIQIAQSWPRREKNQPKNPKVPFITKEQHEKYKQYIAEKYRDKQEEPWIDNDNFTEELKISLLKEISAGKPLTLISKEQKIYFKIIHKLAISIGWTNEWIKKEYLI